MDASFFLPACRRHPAICRQSAAVPPVCRRPAKKLAAGVSDVVEMIYAILPPCRPFLPICGPTPFVVSSGGVVAIKIYSIPPLSLKGEKLAAGRQNLRK